MLKTRPDRTEKSGDPVRGCCYLAWLFQKAYLKPKLACIKSFTDELKLCRPLPTMLPLDVLFTRIEQNETFYGYRTLVPWLANQ